METKDNIIKRMELFINDPYLSKSTNKSIIDNIEHFKRDIKALKKINQEEINKYGDYTFWELVKSLTFN